MSKEQLFPVTWQQGFRKEHSNTTALQSSDSTSSPRSIMGI